MCQPALVRYDGFLLFTGRDPSNVLSSRFIQKSATTSRAGGMRMAPGRGRCHLCWWPLIFKKNFFDLCFIGSVGFDDDLTDSSLAVSCSLQSNLVLVVRLSVYPLTVINNQKFFFISIHKPPASIRFAHEACPRGNGRTF